MRFQSTPIKLSLLYKQFSQHKKNTIMMMLKDAFTGKKSSFYQKQIHIYEIIKKYSTIIGELLGNNTYGSLSKYLFEYTLGEEKEHAPSQKDILWVLEVITQIHNFVTTHNSSIENHLILCTMDSTFFSSNNTINTNVLIKECEHHLEKYSELLLIQDSDLEKLLTKTKLYYPSFSKETILLGIGANIRFSSKMGELLEEDEEWEQEFRLEGSVLDPSNLHLCAMLDEEELLSFIEESEGTQVSQLIDTIIKQLTLEEFYRTENEQIFARISNILSFLPKNCYHNLPDPVRKLHTFAEYIYNKYTFLTSLPISIQSELLNHALYENTTHNHNSVDLIFSQIDIIAQIICYLTKEEHLSLREQEKLIHKYYTIIQPSNKFPLSHITSFIQECYDNAPKNTSIQYCSLLLSFSLEETVLLLQHKNRIKTLLSSHDIIDSPLLTQKNHILTILSMEVSKPFSDLYKDTTLFLVSQYIENNANKTISISTIRSFIEKISLSYTKVLSLEKNIFIKKIRESSSIYTFFNLNTIETLLLSLNNAIADSPKEEIPHSNVIEEYDTKENFSSYSHQFKELSKIIQEIPPIQ
ncbi:MAG: hypothetical protein ACRCV3_02355 [Desulfovibrionaceae bacterium]